MNDFALRLKGRRPLLFAALLTACALLCLALLTGRAFADAETPTISYDGAARQLTVQGAQGPATATDLFPTFKNLMPGDKRQQDVAVRVSGVDSEVSVYAKAVVDDETAQALEPLPFLPPFLAMAVKWRSMKALLEGFSLIAFALRSSQLTVRRRCICNCRCRFRFRMSWQARTSRFAGRSRQKTIPEPSCPPRLLLQVAFLRGRG